MLKFGNKEFRNLQEQVKKNMDDILFILQEEGVLNEFGIKVVGQEDSVLDMPTVEDYKEDHEDWSYGDAYAIGTEEPYELYILTRANGTHPDDYWFNIGEFPAPGPQGEQGPTGETGPQGPTGPSGQDGVSPEISIGSVSATTLSASASATASVSMTGTYAQPVLNFAFGIPQGQDGSTPTSIPWGNITGSLANQTDLVSALQGKANVSALSSYATKTYADNVGSNATYQAVSDIRTNDNEFLGSMLFDSEVVFGSHIYKAQSNYSDYPIELPNGSGTLALTRDIPSLSGYATEAWVSANFLSADTPIGGSAEWGSISGTLTNQTDLMSKFSEYAKIEDIPSLSGYATETWVLSQNYASQTWVNSQISNATSDFVSTGVLSSYATLNELSSYATVSDLSSYALQSELSLYASVSALNSAISGVESTISALDYASVGALSSATVIPDITGLASESWVSANFLSSDTYIPTISGTNDGSYWTSITIDEDTYDIPQGSSGDYVPILVEDSDENYRYSGEIQNSDSAITIQVIKEESDQVATNKATSLELYQDDAYLSHSYQELVSKENPDYDPEDPETGSETIEEAVDLSTNIYVGEGTVTVNRSLYDEGLQEVVNEEVDLFDLASQVNTLSSTVADIPVVSGTNDGQYWTDLTIGSDTYSLYAGGGQAQAEWGQIGGTLSNQTDLMSKFSEYAKLSDSNTFTGSNTFNSNIYLSSNRGIYFGSSAGYISGADSGYLRVSASSRLNLNANLSNIAGSAVRFGLYSGSSSYGYVYIPNVSGNHTVALLDDIPSVSEYATISAVSSAINDLSSIYASISYVDALSSVYAPIGYLPSGVSGYASEIWTFTLSDNTSVSKTILVG